MPPPSAPHRRTLLAALPVLLAAACAPSVTAHGPAAPRPHPDVEVEERRTFYDVVGRSAAEIGASLAREAPPHGDLRVYGLTRWNVTWDYGMDRSAAGCRLTRPRVVLEIETVLPRWTGRAGAGAELARRWDRFAAAVRRHEDGHRELVREAGERIRSRLAGLWDVSCELLEGRAEERARSIVVGSHDRNLAYDVRTGGGAEQGVRWP